MARASDSYAATSDAPRLSRRLVREMLVLWHAEDLADVAELLTSELVANVVMHAMTTVAVDLDWDDPTLRVEVRDGSPILPAIPKEARLEGGRGLQIVAALAREWGVTPLADGKAVWFTVRRHDSGS